MVEGEGLGGPEWIESAAQAFEVNVKSLRRDSFPRYLWTEI
jgi:hypothetical protein